MNKEKIRQLALANGFKLKTQSDGGLDLNPYVYDFARAFMQTAQLQAEVEQQESNYLVVNFGHGTIEVAEGISEDTYALMLGNGGGGVVGEYLQGDRHMTKHETLAVLKFHNVSSIDVVLARLNCLRQRMVNHEPVEIKNDLGEVIEVITPKLQGAKP